MNTRYTTYTPSPRATVVTPDALRASPGANAPHRMRDRHHDGIRDRYDRDKYGEGIADRWERR